MAIAYAADDATAAAMKKQMKRFLARLKRESDRRTKHRFDGVWCREGVAGGRPCLTESGILASVIVGMFAAGDEIGSLAKNYRVPRKRIEHAIRLVLVALAPRKLPLQTERRMYELLGQPIPDWLMKTKPLRIEDL